MELIPLLTTLYVTDSVPGSNPEPSCRHRPVDTDRSRTRLVMSYQIVGAARGASSGASSTLRVGALTA